MSSEGHSGAGGSEETLVEVRARLTELQGKITALEKENRILEGRVKNLSPQALRETQQKLEAAQARLSRLGVAQVILLLERQLAHSALDQETDLESFKKYLLDFCKSKKVDPEIWKKLES